MDSRYPGRMPGSGWLIFAGILVFVIGSFNVIEALVALFEDEYYVIDESELLVFDFTAWGWIFLVIGIVQILTALGILAGAGWARLLGVMFAIVAAIGQILYLNAFPVWSILVIALCVLVIYALVVPPDDALAG
jgi:hypothetical protein